MMVAIPIRYAAHHAMSSGSGDGEEEADKSGEGTGEDAEEVAGEVGSHFSIGQRW